MQQQKIEPGKRAKVSLIPSSETYKIISAFSDHHKSNIFEITVTLDNKHINFLVDTGADISILPKNNFDSDCTEITRHLVSADNSPIRYHGQKTIHFTIAGFKEKFTWSFAVASVSRPILGADFLSRHKIDVSCHNSSIYRQSTNEKSEATQVNAAINCSKSNNSNSSSVRLQIVTTGAPIAQRQRPLFGEKLFKTKEEFQRLLDAGIIRPSKSNWASPLVVVKKSDGSWRPCGDYRLLNEATQPDRYPLPRIQDLLNRVDGSCIFTKLDLEKAYHQIPICPEDIPKTAVITPFGLFEYTTMPFGLRNASQTFQRHMDNIFRDSGAHTLTYIDDVLIFSKNANEHEAHIQNVISSLDNAGLTINKNKCEFRKEMVNFLGFELTKQGIKPAKQKTQELQVLGKPNNIQDLRRFIGGINYYHWLIPNLSDILCPLHELLQRSIKEKSFIWEEVHTVAIERAKSELLNITRVGYPNPRKAFLLCTDASAKAIGASLNQQNEGNKSTPIAFFSRKFNKAEEKYSTFDRELLAIYLSIKHFKHYLEGSHFTVMTDHKPLTKAMHMKDPSPRQWRILERLSQFDFDIQFIKGEDNVVADLLSRPCNTEIQNAQTIELHHVRFTKEELKKEQEKDHTLSTLKNSSLELAVTDDKILIDNSTGETRIVLPKIFRYSEFLRIHDISHPASKPTIELMKTRYVWPNMKSDIRQWCKQCQRCQVAKITRHTHSPFGKIETKGRFKTVHLDIVGPLPINNNKKYILTMIDRGTSWVEAIPIYEITADMVIKTFEREWISRYGVPETIITDQGLQFQSEKVTNFCSKMGIERCRTTAYHPQSNGKIERWHRAMKNSLRATSENAAHTWLESLPKILLSLRNCSKSNGSPSASQLTFGCQARLPGDFILNTPELNDNEDNLTHINEQIVAFEKNVKTTRPLQHSYVDKLFLNCKKVWLRTEFRKSLEDPYTGPYEVIDRSTDLKTFKIRVGDGIRTISIDRLKPWIGRDEFAPLS